MLMFQKRRQVNNRQVSIVSQYVCSGLIALTTASMRFKRVYIIKSTGKYTLFKSLHFLVFLRTGQKFAFNI